MPTVISMTRSEFLAKSAELGGPIIVQNHYGRFDVALPSGDSESYDTMQSAQEEMLLGMGLGEFSAFFVMLADGGYQKFSLSKTVNIQCGLCEGSGERSKWDVCPECDGRCEKLYQDGYDGGGWPHWVSQTCRSCNGAGGAEHVYQCGFCSGAGFVECAESALMASDTIIQKELVAA